MPKMKRREEWLTEVLTFSHHYRGYEISARIHEFGGLHVIVYNDDNAELVHRCDNVCHALNWIDAQTKDQVWED